MMMMMMIYDDVLLMVMDGPGYTYSSVYGDYNDDHYYDCDDVYDDGDEWPLLGLILFCIFMVIMMMIIMIMNALMIMIAMIFMAMVMSGPCYTYSPRPYTHPNHYGSHDDDYDYDGDFYDDVDILKSILIRGPILENSNR